MTQLLQLRAEEIQNHFNDIRSIPLDESAEERGNRVLAHQNYSGAVADLMDFKNLFDEDIADDESEL